ncbi:signal transduction protein [endosymbiont of unidentified scaly snail isolate Monju]|nr:signal transduction protein [endosymbiont of unidentified scaly snail isolate Monju]
MAPHFIADLYDFFRRFEPTRHLLADQEQIDTLLEKQLEYFNGLTNGNYGPQYVTHRLMVGVAHARAGLHPKWYIAAYRRYLRALVPHLYRNRHEYRGQFEDYVDSLIKIIFFDMDLAMEAYHHTDRILRQQQERILQRIMDKLPSGVFIVAPNGSIKSANPAAKTIFGLGSNITKKSLKELLPRSDVDDMLAIAINDRKYHGEATLSVNGTERFLAIHLSILNTDSQVSDTPNILLTVEDFTDLRRMEEESLRLATSDILTGLANRLQLMERLTQGISSAKRKHSRLGVLFLDLDNFKNINDTLGHAAGDQLLQQMAARLKSKVRSTDTLARFGGDEFVLVANDIQSRYDCERIIDHILEIFENPFDLDGREYRLKGSIGASLYPDDAEDPHSLLKYADSAMYQAKADVSRRYSFFNRNEHRHFTDRLNLEQSLRLAVERDQLVIKYQPIISLDDLSVIGFEALLRWEDPELASIPPSRFVPLLEENGLIHTVGEWVLKKVCAMSASHPRFCFSVNVASQQFNDPDFARQLFLMLTEHNLSGDRIEIELTESTLLERTSVTIENLNAVANMGISIAIDDFGTGYSSLSYLKRFPIRRIKIDKSFVHDITSSEESASLTRAIVGLGKTLNMEITAEGIETDEQLDLLRHWGCDAGQGYYFSKPIGPDKIGKMKI